MMSLFSFCYGKHYLQVNGNKWRLLTTYVQVEKWWVTNFQGLSSGSTATYLLCSSRRAGKPWTPLHRDVISTQGSLHNIISSGFLLLLFTLTRRGTPLVGDVELNYKTFCMKYRYRAFLHCVSIRVMLLHEL